MSKTNRTKFSDLPEFRDEAINDLKLIRSHLELTNNPDVLELTNLIINKWKKMKCKNCTYFSKRHNRCNNTWTATHTSFYCEDFNLK